MGFPVGAGLTLGIMTIFAQAGLLDFDLPNFLLTSFCCGRSPVSRPIIHSTPAGSSVDAQLISR
jgi:hypothetical protein